MIVQGKMSYQKSVKTEFIITFLFYLFLFLILPGQTWGQSKTHLIGPQDVLTLNIYAGGEQQQEVNLTVSDDNMVNVPFIGSIKAEKLTISELEERITKALKKDYFVAPQIHIHIKGYHSLRYSVSVEGEVKKPGVYDYQRGITALKACIMAGGFDKFAAPNRARIIRTEDDKRVVIKLDLNDVKEGKIPDIELKPGDRIHIPEAWL